MSGIENDSFKRAKIPAWPVIRYWMNILDLFKPINLFEN